MNTWKRPIPRGKNGGRRARPSSIDLTQPVTNGRPRAPLRKAHTGPYSRNSRVQLFQWSSELDLLVRVHERRAVRVKRSNPDSGSAGQAQRRTLAVPDSFGIAPDVGVIPRCAWEACWLGARPGKPPRDIQSYRMVRGCCGPETRTVYLPETLPHVDYIRARLADIGIGTLLF